MPYKCKHLELLHISSSVFANRYSQLDMHDPACHVLLRQV